MEPDELKELLQTRIRPVQHKSVHELAGYYKKNSRSVINRIKRSIVLELAFGLLFILFIIPVMVLIDGDYTRIFCMLMLTYALFFLTYLFRLYVQIQHNSSTDTTIADHIKQVITIIENFKRHYFRLTVLFVPVALLFAFTAGFLDRMQPGAAFGGIIAWQRTLLYAGCCILWCMLMYAFTKRYVKRLYGSHLQHLRNQLHALEEE